MRGNRSKGSLIIEAAIVVPVCLIAATAGIVLLLAEWQAGNGALAAARAADEAVRMLSESSAQAEEGLYGRIGLDWTGLGESGSLEAAASAEGLRDLAERYAKAALDRESSLAERRRAGWMSALARTMEDPALPPERVTLRIRQDAGFPAPRLTVTVEQRFEIPLFGGSPRTARASVLLAAPNDLADATDLLIDLAGRFLPYLRELLTVAGGGADARGS
jgi:hypothetical protein